MITVDTVLKVRLAKRDGKSLRGIADKYRLARNTVRKYVRTEETEPGYRRRRPKEKPKLGPYVELLERLLEEDQPGSVRARRSAQLLFEELQRQGYQGAYDSVRRHVQQWHRDRRALGQVFVPLVFAPGEAFQFDWSEETLVLGGRATKVSLAQFRLCHSRALICFAYLRESLEMVLEAHVKAFAFFGGVPRRGIYDNLKTVVSKILLGKERQFNAKFLALASHYLFEPAACTPAAGWEKGQVEKQVGLIRSRFLGKRRRFADLEELNQFLLMECLGWAKSQPHPEDRSRTCWEVYEQEERSQLTWLVGAFDGFIEKTVRVSSTALIHFDRNHYSVDCARAKRTAQVRAYADRVVIVSNGELIGEHQRQFGRDQTVYDPWHYLPVLERKPGALRNGAPFQEWELPQPIKELWQVLRERPGGDREFVGVLNAVRTYGAEAVAQAASEALTQGTVSFDVVYNLLSRQTEQPPPASLAQVPAHLTLTQRPWADCGRYDQLLAGGSHAAG